MHSLHNFSNTMLALNKLCPGLSGDWIEITSSREKKNQTNETNSEMIEILEFQTSIFKLLWLVCSREDGEKYRFVSEN